AALGEWVAGMACLPSSIGRDLRRSYGGGDRYWFCFRGRDLRRSYGGRSILVLVPGRDLRRSYGGRLILVFGVATCVFLRRGSRPTGLIACRVAACLSAPTN